MLPVADLFFLLSLDTSNQDEHSTSVLKIENGTNRREQMCVCVFLTSAGFYLCLSERV